jgi:TIR domain
MSKESISSIKEENYRVFLSYSHSDKKVAKKIVKKLQNLNLTVLWDEEIRPSVPFSNSIKNMITYSHLFISLITNKSKYSPWVHQEIGYAVAINIPILPIAIGNLPKGMIKQIHAVTLDIELESFDKIINLDFIKETIENKPSPSLEIVKVAYLPEKRTEFMAKYANGVIDRGNYGKVRQIGPFSSFSIPDTEVDDKMWKIRDNRDKHYHNLQREERISLEKHVEQRGCKLIIDPSLIFTGRPKEATINRLETLRQFLIKNRTNKNIEIAICNSARERSLTIVGNWFSALSINPDPSGYKQTIFSWHAKEVLDELNKFDILFNEILEGYKFRPKNSCDYAIKEVEKCLEEII